MFGLVARRSVVIAAVMVLPGLALGEEADKPEKNSADLSQALVSDIEMFGIRSDGTRYQIAQPHLLMKIYAPARGRNLDRLQTGALWAWGEGRPIALTEVWRWQNDQLWGHTLISTTPGYVTATAGSQTWKPEQPGLRFTEMPLAATPGDTVSERTEQLLQLASRFTGYEIVNRKIVELTMLPKPIYRYSEAGINGALFALAQGENPEAFLFLEAVSDPVGPSYWRYAWARGTSSLVTVELDGNELLQIPGTLNDLGKPSEPFWVYFRSTAEEEATFSE